MRKLVLIFLLLLTWCRPSIESILSQDKEIAVLIAKYNFDIKTEKPSLEKENEIPLLFQGITHKNPTLVTLQAKDRTIYALIDENEGKLLNAIQILKITG